MLAATWIHLLHIAMPNHAMNDLLSIDLLDHQIYVELNLLANATPTTVLILLWDTTSNASRGLRIPGKTQCDSL